MPPFSPSISTWIRGKNLLPSIAKALVFLYIPSLKVNPGSAVHKAQENKTSDGKVLSCKPVISSQICQDVGEPNNMFGEKSINSTDLSKW